MGASVNEELHIQIERDVRRKLRRRAMWNGAKRYVAHHWPVAVFFIVAVAGVAFVVSSMVR